MNVRDFMDIVKREARYGRTSAYSASDKPTLDILAAINIRRKRIWSKWDWKWALEELATQMVVNQTEYSITSLSGALVDRITDLIPQDRTVTPPVLGAPLIQLERQDFFTWIANTIPTQDIPSRYVNIGLDANGLWKIILWPAPSTAFTMGGYAKKILDTLLLADVTDNESLGYFPDGVIEDVLLDGVLSDISRIQGKEAVAERLDISFETKLKQKVKEQVNAGIDDSGITSPVPDSYRWKKRSRRGTTVV